MHAPAHPVGPAGARTRVRAAWLAVVVGVGLLGAKLFGAWLTGSAAILSDALESLVNVVTAIVALVSVRIANAPADENHPLGHGKVEALTSAVEGALLLGTGIAIVWASMPSFIAPRPLVSLEVGLGIVAATAVINAVTGVYLIRVGREHHSMALEADGKHLMTDVVTSIGLLVGLGLVLVTEAWWLDPLVACGVALWILITGARVMRRSIGTLMDERLDDHVEAVLHALRDPPEGLLDPHDLRVVDAGTERFLSLHAHAPRYWDLTRTRALRDEVGARLARAFDAPVTPVLQVEPCHDGQCTACSMADCPVRAAPLAGAAVLDRARLISPEPAASPPPPVV